MLEGHVHPGFVPLPARSAWERKGLSKIETSITRLSSISPSKVGGLAANTPASEANVARGLELLQNSSF